MTVQSNVDTRTVIDNFLNSILLNRLILIRYSNNNCIQLSLQVLIDYVLKVLMIDRVFTKFTFIQYPMFMKSKERHLHLHCYDNFSKLKYYTCFDGDLAASYWSSPCHRHSFQSMRRAQQLSAHRPPLYRSLPGYRTDKLPTRTGSSLQQGWTASLQQNWPNMGGRRSFSLSSRKSSCGLTSSPAFSSLNSFSLLPGGSSIENYPRNTRFSFFFG